MSKTVRFNPINTIIITYSADEYDRSYFTSAAIPLSYTIRPADNTTVNNKRPTIASSLQRPAIKPLDLSIIPNSRRRALDSPVQGQKSSKKPKLTINTQSLTPLFFSSLSTHYKCRNEDDEEEDGYLIPVMAC